MPTSTGGQPATVNIRGEKGEVVRVAPSMRDKAWPHSPASPGSIVDVWVMPGGMHVACLHGDNDRYTLVLAYIDNTLRTLLVQQGLPEHMAVDIWHVHPLPLTTDDTGGRALMRHLAHAAADGAVDFEPIRPGQRRLWDTAIEALSAVVARPPAKTV